MHYLGRKLEERFPGTRAYQEKRKKEMEKNEVFLVNQQLQQVIQSLQVKKLKEEEVFKTALKKANKEVVSSSILSLQYRNNFENKKVALDTIEFLLKIGTLLDEKEQKKLLHQLQQPKNQLSRIAYGELSEINRLERAMHQKTKAKK